jgi:hypothetical protein
MSVLIAVSFNRFLEQNRSRCWRGARCSGAVCWRRLRRSTSTTRPTSRLRTFIGCCASCAAARSTRDEARAVFAALDQDNSGSVDLLEFFRITDVLLLGFYRLPDRHAHRSKLTRFKRSRRACCASCASRWFNVLSAMLIVLSFRRHLPLGGATSTTRRCSRRIFDTSTAHHRLFLVEVLMRMGARCARVLLRRLAHL